MPHRAIRKHPVGLALALLLIGVGLLAVAQGLRLSQLKTDPPTETPLPTKPQERLIPTATDMKAEDALPSPWPTGTKAAALPSPTTPVHPTFTALSPPATPTPDAALSTPAPALTTAPTATWTLQPTLTTQDNVGLFSPRQRIGFVAPMGDVESYDVAQLGAGWYLGCHDAKDPTRLGGMECARGVWVSGSAFRPDASSLRDIARRDPGRVWLVGNEPDVIWQGNATPQQYAQVYHDVYQALKAADPTCQVAIGGISQVTPLRLRYLEAVLAAYEEAYGQPMPVDVWNVHLAILREERGSWGVDIPPGLPDDTGILYEIEDNAKVEILKRQVVAFRRWMAERGLREKPLIVTEFSVLMPPDYGFPFEPVRAFLFAASDFFMTAVDDDLGYPADGGRLVQRWAWYSLADTVYYTGNLFDPDTGQITPLGKAFGDYAAGW